MTTATVAAGSYRSQRLTLPSGERTWTVLGTDHRMVEPAEEYLEYLRAQQASPNTVKSYARALALWWQYLDAFDRRWDAVTLEEFGAFLTWLRTGDEPEVVSIERRPARFSESTIATRLAAVLACYDYHVLNGVDVGRDLHRITHRGGGRYKPLLEHIARRKGRRQAVIRVRQRRQSSPPPILTPQQIERICEACASWDTDTRQWRGSVRNRLLWMLLAETGVRLGEALGLQHRDWHTGRGDTPFIEVVARDHPHGVRAKSGYRRLYVSDELDHLYGEYVWQLCDAGADLATDDFDAAHVFVNLDREPRFAPWRPESVYDLVDRLRRRLSGQVPQTWTPHWMRHSHATALLLSGVAVHVVSRRLGHVDVQTTLNTYAHVTEDAEMRTVAPWKAFTAGLANRRARSRADRVPLVTGRSAQTARDWVEAARGRCDLRALEDLWAAVPEAMRLSRFAESTVPPQYAGAFCHDGTWRAGVDLSQLPEPMRREVAWCVFRIIELGGKIPTPALTMLVRRLGEVLADRAGQAPASLLGLSGRDWCRHIQHAAHRRTAQLPAATTMNNIRQLLTRLMRLLVTAMDTGPWWHRDLWNPVEDTRIPLRDHEPMGRYSVRFDRIDTRWLRRGLQWHCKVGLDTGVLSWSTVHRRIVAVKEFDVFLHGRQVDGPALADHAAGVRALMLDFLGHLRAREVTRGRRTGQRLSPASVQRLAGDVEQFYLFMADNKDAAAVALAEPGWLRLGPQHAGFYRRGELPGKQQARLEGHVIDDDAMTQIMGGLELLGAAVEHGGFGDEQAMRIAMLVALLGRRVSEICLLDRDPLLPLLPAAAAGQPDAAGESDAQTPPVAKLRYQQTKIDGAPNTILVHAEVVAIIREQQQWAQRYFAEHSAPGTTPKYLFLATKMNRNGDRPYTDRTLRSLLTELAARLDVRDSTGAVVDFNRTHRFRHTIATSLLNSGVPLHVLQRYLGHLTPTMSMTYAQTLQSTAEREFLRYRKITADARDLEIDPQDLYDMLALDRRTDRILPNGWCLLPPRQSCNKGNACLTCDKFATDATFLPELRTQRARTAGLIDDRRTAFEARTGQPMNEDNIWLAGRRQEHDALGRIILKLEHTRLADGTVRAVRGAGVDARIDAITGEQGPR